MELGSIMLEAVWLHCVHRGPEASEEADPEASLAQRSNILLVLLDWNGTRVHRVDDTSIANARVDVSQALRLHWSSRWAWGMSSFCVCRVDFAGLGYDEVRRSILRRRERTGGSVLTVLGMGCWEWENVRPMKSKTPCPPKGWGPGAEGCPRASGQRVGSVMK